MEIKRDFYLKKLIEAKEDNLIKIITGIRRCGKSYLLNNIFYNYLMANGVREDHIIKIALDDKKNSEFLDADKLDEYVRSKIVDNNLYYILLDEIQLVKDFEFVLNGFLRINNVDIYVTGSNSKFLSSDIITELRGRGEEIKVYPLSFQEFMSVYKENELKGWSEYITYGGLPLVVLMNTDERKMKYLEEQRKNVYINDVIERNNLKENNELETLVQIISSSIGSLTNQKRLSDTFKSEMNLDISQNTIGQYLKFLEEAFIVEKANRYDVKGKKYINTPIKYYFSDIGIRNSFINFRQDEETHIMENIIFLELKRRGYNVDVGIVEDRGKDYYKQLEVDFIANKGNNRIYIQSAYSIPTKEKREQEERSLLKINDAFKKIIIVKDYIKRGRDEKGVITMNIFDFLLDEKSLEY